MLVKQLSSLKCACHNIAMFMFVTTLVFIFIIRLRFPSEVSIAFEKKIMLITTAFAIRCVSNESISSLAYEFLAALKSWQKIFLSSLKKILAYIHSKNCSIYFLGTTACRSIRTIIFRADVDIRTDNCHLFT